MTSARSIRFLAVAVVLTMVFAAVPLSSSSADSEAYVLIDLGNGETYWVEADETQTTLDGVIKAAAESEGLSCTTGTAVPEIAGLTALTVGSLNTADVYWHYYVWSGSAWEDKTSSYSGSAAFGGSTIAVEYCTDGTVPVETPDHMDAWISITGNSENRAWMESVITDDEFASVYELARSSEKYESYVCTQVLYAGGSAYVFFGGGHENGANPPEAIKLSPGESGWTIDYIVGFQMGMGYETQSCAIIGDYLYVPTSYGYLYKVPLSDPGTQSSYVQISANTVTQSDSSAAVTGIKYKLTSASTYADAELEEMDSNAYDIPVSKNKNYNIILTADVDGKTITYTGILAVNSKGAATLELTGDDAGSLDLSLTSPSTAFVPIPVKIDDVAVSGVTYKSGSIYVSALKNLKSSTYDIPVEVPSSGTNSYDVTVRMSTGSFSGTVKVDSSGNAVLSATGSSSSLSKEYTVATKVGLSITTDTIEGYKGEAAVDSVTYTYDGSSVTSKVSSAGLVISADAGDELGLTLATTIGGARVNYTGTLTATAGTTPVTMTREATTVSSTVYLVSAYSDVDMAWFSKERSPNFDYDSLAQMNSGLSHLTVWGGLIYAASSSGYMYCIDTDLNVLWSYDMGGQVYYSGPTVHDGTVFIGAGNAMFYALDAATGALLDSMEFDVYENASKGSYCMVGSPVFVGDTMYLGTSDGLVMDSIAAGIAILTWDSDGKKMTLVKEVRGKSCSTRPVPVETDDFSGIYYVNDNGLVRMDSTGSVETMVSTTKKFSASPVLLNEKYIVLDEYSVGQKNDRTGVRTGGMMYIYNLGGELCGQFDRMTTGVDDYCMASPTIIDGYMFIGTDGGFCIATGKFAGDPVPTPEGGGGGGFAVSGPVLVGIAAVAVVAVLLAACVIGARRAGVPVGAYTRGAVGRITGITAEGITRTKAMKRRLLWIIIVGVIVTISAFLACLSIGPSLTLSPWEALGAAISAAQKGGTNLNLTELVVYNSRLPRAIAALSVGLGLAVAGAIYQAVIRNPLVDPYIMGVSSGAGTFAVAGIASGFTLFGLLSNSDFTVPILAIIGGLVAFGLTMLIGQKAGGSSTSYVLAGVVIGLAFSSVQTVLLTTSSSEKLQNAISWLYGSFTQVDWNTVWIIFFPALFMSIASLLWAKDLNLILLGEDNARQMGLDTKKFNAIMLVLASVLTSVCVAFVGIIGFVGLVVPHLCRMLLGGDHRMVLPSSMVIGAAVMLIADLLARMIAIPLELPVGAITTVIGVPVFAYLLMSRGRMYDG